MEHGQADQRHCVATGDLAIASGVMESVTPQRYAIKA